MKHPAVVDTELVSAYRQCRHLCQHHARTFSLACQTLPPIKRRAIQVIYAFCRYADDLVDRLEPPAARPALAAWRDELLRTYDGRPSHPIMLAYADTLRRYPIPLAPALDLLHGLETDIGPCRLETWEELYLYCYRVAATVGLLCLPVLGVRSTAAAGHAIELGVAMQLTNILRDIGEDQRLDRVYLPLAEIRRFGYSLDRLQGGVVDGSFIDLMQFQIARARGYYQRAAPGIEQLHGDARLPILLASVLYSRILDRIEANRWDVFSRRAHLSWAAKLYHGLLAMGQLPRLIAFS